MNLLSIPYFPYLLSLLNQIFKLLLQNGKIARATANEKMILG